MGNYPIRANPFWSLLVLVLIYLFVDYELTNKAGKLELKLA